MDAIYSKFQETFHKVRPLVVKDTVSRRTQGELGNPRDPIEVSYTVLDDVAEVRRVNRYPAAYVGSSSRGFFNLSSDGELSFCLQRRLCATRNSDPSKKKSTKTDGIVPVRRNRNGIVQPNPAPKFLVEEARILLNNKFLAPHALFYTERESASDSLVTPIPKRAYFVLPLHGRTLCSATEGIVRHLVAGLRLEGQGAAQYQAELLFAKNLCYDVWYNLNHLRERNVVHFDLKADNFVVRFPTEKNNEVVRQGELQNLFPLKESLTQDENGYDLPSFILVDYERALEQGSQEDLYDRCCNLVFPDFDDDHRVSNRRYQRNLIGTEDLAHPIVLINDGILFRSERRRAAGVDHIQKFNITHSLDRFSAGLMLCRELQDYRRSDRAGLHRAEEENLFENLKFFQSDDGNERIVGANYLLRYTAFRKYITNHRESVLPEERPYFDGWSRFFCGIENLDENVSEYIKSLMNLDEEGFNDPTYEDTQYEEQTDAELETREYNLVMLSRESGEQEKFRRAIRECGALETQDERQLQAMLNRRRVVMSKAFEAQSKVLVEAQACFRR